MCDNFQSLLNKSGNSEISIGIVVIKRVMREKSQNTEIKSLDSGIKIQHFVKVCR